MANQVVIPATGAGGTFQQAYPQPLSRPITRGDPPEGPLSFLASMSIPAGALTATQSFNVSQFGMSMVQSLLVDNEANNIGITVLAGTIGTNFGIQPQGTQVIPVFLSGNTLTITVSITTAQSAAVVIAIQVFNYFVPPASWVSNLTVGGNVSVAAVSGNVNVSVAGANILGVSLQAAIAGGAKSFLITGLTTTVTMIKAASGPGTFKGAAVVSAATGFLQIFDAASPGSVTLGTTAPTFSFSIQPVNTPQLVQVPPEGLIFNNGLQAAWTTLINNNVAPASNLQGNIYYI